MHVRLYLTQECGCLIADNPLSPVSTGITLGWHSEHGGAQHYNIDSL